MKRFNTSKVIISTILAVLIVVVIATIVFHAQRESDLAIRFTPTPQSSSAMPDERTVINLIERLPDVRLLKAISPQGDTEGITIRVTERPHDDNPYFVAEAWEDLSGEYLLFQKYRYDPMNDEVVIELLLNPDRLDIFTRSVIDKETGEILAIIDGGEKEKCSDGTQLVLNFCARRKLDLADNVLNIIYARIIMDSNIPQGARDTLIVAQKEWMNRKESECKEKIIDYGNGVLGYESGTSAPFIEATCKEKMSRERINELVNTYLQ
jgi:uncharacterized protein YecT (DUF1311 family)